MATHDHGTELPPRPGDLFVVKSAGGRQKRHFRIERWLASDDNPDAVLREYKIEADDGSWWWVRRSLEIQGNGAVPRRWVGRRVELEGY